MRSSFLRRFTTEQHGSVLVIFGLTFLILVGVGGAGYDLGRQQLIKQKLQQATDAAALAGAGMPFGSTDYDRQITAQRYYALNFPAGYLGVNSVPPVSITPTGNSLEVTADNVVQTAFVRNLPSGPTSLDAKGDSVANVRIDGPVPIDIVLLIDNSESMSTTDVGTGPTQDVPSGLQATARTNGLNQCFTDNRQYFDQPESVALYGYVDNASIQSQCNIKPNVWDGGYHSTVNGPQKNDDYGVIGINRINAVRYSANYLADQLLTTNPNHNRISVLTWTTHKINTLGITEDKSQVQDAINTMASYGNTTSTVALQEVQDNLQYSMYPYTSGVRAVILLTDGANSTTIPIASPPSNSQMNNDSIALCNQLKTEHITVYTVAFGQEVANNTQVHDFLSACASGVAGSNEDITFFVAPDAATLADKFKNIITNLQRTRITK